MIRIEYGVIVEGAKEGFEPSLSNCADISNAADLKKEDLVFKNFTNPCENFSVLLDGGRLPIPENTSEENMGVWSLYASDSLGQFGTTLPTVALISDEEFDVNGLTFTFDVVNNIYPTDFSVFWYKDTSLLESKYCVSNSAVFSVYENVSGANKIIIVFDKMNTPNSRLKFHSIQYGSVLIIPEKSIQNMRVHQEVSPISTTVPISTLELSFLNTQGANYDFAARESLKIFDNTTLIGKYFIETANQTNKQKWNIEAQDYIALLESTEFEGGIYNDELAVDILSAIFVKANVPFIVADALQDARVTGYIPYTTCRKAAQQVLFAIGAYANTAYSEKIEILETDATVIESVGLDRVFSGQKVSVDADVTAVELIGHTYTEGDSATTLYKSTQEETEVKVIFNEPVTVESLSLDNGTILERGVNYAIISCPENSSLTGIPYKHLTFSKSKSNSATTNKKSSNKKTVQKATLISNQNIDKVLELCYNYVTRTISVRSKIIEGESPLITGKTYEIETEIMGKVTGILSEQTFSLFGGKKVSKETVIK